MIYMIDDDLYCGIIITSWELYVDAILYGQIKCCLHRECHVTFVSKLKVELR